MSIRFYMDQHVPGAVTRALRLRDVDVLTAFEDGSATLDDASLLDRATALDRVLVTQDDDFFAEAARRQAAGIAFAGIVYSHRQRVSYGQCIEDLEYIAKAGTPADLQNFLIVLPL